MPGRDSEVPHPRIEVTKEQFDALRRGWWLNAYAKMLGYADSEDMEQQIGRPRREIESDE